MSGDSPFLDVKILGREYRIACPNGEEDALMSAVQLVDEKMHSIAHKTKNTIPERVAVMAALNIAHEHLSTPRPLLETPATSFDRAEAKRRIEAMEAKLDTLLDQQEQDL